MTTTFVDFEITKADTQADGTVIVRGPATTDDVDSDRQIIDATFAAKKLPEWLASGGNVRRMHQPDAVGGGMTLEREGSSQILTAHIIDPVAAKLASPHPVTGVRVLRAFSVGISGAKIVKDMRAPGGRIVDGEFVEVSLVDRPANAACKVDLVSKMADGSAHFTDILTKADDMDDPKDCDTCHGTGKIRDGNMDCPDCDGRGKMTAEKLFALAARRSVEGALYKKDYSTEERKEMAEKGHALPDGCLSGDTLVATRDGARPIASLVGPIELLTDEGWRQAEVRCFGIGRLDAVVLRRGPVERTVFATSNHRWYAEVVDDDIDTNNFGPTQHPVASAAKQPSDVTGRVVVINVEGRPLSTGRGVASSALGHSTAEGATTLLLGDESVKVGEGEAVFASEDAFAPDEPARIAYSDGSAAYLRPFLTAELAVGSAVTIPHVEVGMWPPYATGAARDGSLVSNGDTGHAHTSDSTRWSVVSVYETNRVEPVYCAVVPELHRFALADGILTGNSYPIADTEDLHNAYTLAASGHGDVSAAKSLIARRAKELGVANPFEKDDDAEKRETFSTGITEGVVTKKKGKLPKDDAKVTEALQEATAAQDDDNAAHMDGDTEDDEEDDAMKSDAPYVLKRLHDHLCAAFTPDATKSAYPTVRDFGDVIDPGYFGERVTEIIGLDGGTGRYALDLTKASTAYGLAVNLAKMDEETTLAAREQIAKSFSDMYPSVHLTPGDIMPGQFRRTYISGGRANQSASAGQKPRLPMNASTPDAQNFDRGYISDGRAANSPSAMGPNSATSSKLSKFECDAEEREVDGISVFKITHAPTGVSAQGASEDDAWEKLKDAVKQRSFYTNNARDQAAEVMTGMHDYIVAMHPGICPMASKQDDEMDDADGGDAGNSQVDNRAGDGPKEQAGYQKLESADIQKMVEAEVEKLVAPLKKKNRKLEKRAEEAEARVVELAKMADPEMGVYRGGRGVIPFVPKQETEQGPGVQAEVEKQERVARLLDTVQQGSDQATSRQAMEKLQSLLSPDELAAALTKTG